MRVGVIISLGASAVLGLAALVVAKTVLPNAAQARVPLMAVQPVTGVPVVVASKPMKFGDRLDADHLSVAHLPQNAVPEGAFTTIAAVLAQDNGGAPVALTPIAVHEALLPSKLSGPGARPSVAAEIADGMRAYTIKVSDATGVGGHALPGDRVDVVLLRDLTPSGEVRNFVSDVVIQDIRVLAVDLNADLTSNKPATPSTATLEVTVQDSQKLAVAADLGKLSLALRKTGAADVAQTGTVRIGGGPAPGRIVHVAARRIRPVNDGGGMISIVEGDAGGDGARARKPAAAAKAPAASADVKAALADKPASPDFKPTAE
jgi:pilus assembly protein CpaB